MKILIVDDLEQWRLFHSKALTKILKDKPYEITTANSAREGYNTATSTKFDLIITDMEMEAVFEENFAGEWLIKQLKNNSSTNNVPIIIISGAYNIKSIAQFYNVDYIPKSVLVSDLLSLKYKIKELNLN